MQNTSRWRGPFAIRTVFLRPTRIGGLFSIAMVALCLLRWTTKALVGLVISAFVAFTVLITLNKILMSSIFQTFTAICYFPFITEALKKGPEAGAFAFLQEDRLYSAAVRPCHRPLDYVLVIMTMSISMQNTTQPSANIVVGNIVAHSNAGVLHLGLHLPSSVADHRSAQCSVSKA